MHFALVTHGSRGDVQPLVALGAELERRGHTTTLAVPVNTVDFVRRAGLTAVSLPGDSQAFLASEETRRCLASGDTREFLARMRAVLAEHGGGIARGLLIATEKADAIVATGTTEDLATVIAEARRLPLVLHHICPMRRTAAVANPLVTGESRSTPGFNRLTHVAYDRARWKLRSGGINQFRAQLGLPATRVPTPQRARALGALELQAYSPNVITGLRWPRYRPVVGWMDLGEPERVALGEYGLDADLSQWLAAGTAPIYVGFGSMPVAEPAAMLAMVERVSTELGLRAVVNAGWAQLAGAGAADPARLRVIGSVDLTALLPLCRGAVHHGGSGTTGLSVRLGVPTLICSVLLDQLMWGQRLERLGVGAHVRYPALNETTLRTGLKRLLDPTVRAAATALGVAVSAEPDPLTTAADLTIAHAQAAA